MKKSMFLGLLIAPALSVSSQVIGAEQAQQAKPTTTAINVMQLSGFECADELLASIAILGRGDDFPNFLAQDVETELKRQSKTSKLLALTCTGEPVIQMASAEVLDQGEQKQVLSTLSVTFPLNAQVKNGKQKIELNLEQNYLVENLDKPGQQKVTKNFIVKN
ncbi:hypothetical protein [Paraglaciecola aestuariivivens]